MKIVLPWPDKRLFPNFKRGQHWRTYRDAEAQAKQDGAHLAFSAANGGIRELRGIFNRSGKIGYKVTFYPPDRRRRDDDGMIGAIKNYRDGICEALGFDDSRLSPHYFFEDPEKPGRVEIELSAPIGDTFGVKNFAHTPENAVNGVPPEETEAA